MTPGWSNQTDFDPFVIIHYGFAVRNMILTGETRWMFCRRDQFTGVSAFGT